MGSPSSISSAHWGRDRDGGWKRSPLTALTGKDVPFVWSSECERAFTRLKELLRNDVFLAAFDWDKPVYLETDASNVAYAGVITQDGPDGIRRPVAMYSHKFRDHEKNWPIHDKELYAIVYAFDRYKHFLRGKFCVEVTTDHRNLAKFMTTTKLTGRLARWWEQLADCNFQVQYRPGEENTVADALSRYGDESPEGTYDCIIIIFALQEIAFSFLFFSFSFSFFFQLHACFFLPNSIVLTFPPKSVYPFVRSFG
jgi:hypothetical protein